MKNSKQKRQFLQVLALTLLVLMLLAVVVVQNRPTKSPPGATPVFRGNSTLDEPNPSPSAKGSPTATPVTVKPSKPTLQKSSGNAPGSSVPAGAVIEFSCEGTPGVFCEVTLTDRSNGRVVALEKKTIASNGRGQYFAIWDWTSEKGSWNAVTKASNTVGDTAVSDIQTLEVK